MSGFIAGTALQLLQSALWFWPIYACFVLVAISLYWVAATKHIAIKGSSGAAVLLPLDAVVVDRAPGVLGQTLFAQYPQSIIFGNTICVIFVVETTLRLIMILETGETKVCK